MIQPVLSHVRSHASSLQASSPAVRFDAMRFVHQQRYCIIGGAACAVAAVSVVYSAVWSLRGSRSPSKRHKEPKRILITGAAGQIAYALAPLIASGQMLGPDQPVILQLYDVPAAAELLQGLQMELQDAAYPMLQGVWATTDFATAAQGASIAVLCGGVPRRTPGSMSKAQLMAANCAIYRDQAAALAAHAAPGVKVVVVASPANTNAWLLQQYAPSIPKHDITALTRLDQNRAAQHLAAILGVPVSDVSNIIVWGNHASSQFPYGHLAKVKGKPILQHDHQHHWEQQQAAVGLDGPSDLEDYLRNEFITIVQNRGATVGRLRHQLSPALSAAAAVCGHVRDWLTGLPHDTDWVSMGVSSDGSYGIAAGLVYSFPVACGRGTWAIIKGLPVDAWAWARMKAAEADLLEERNLALQVLAAAAAAASRQRSAVALAQQQEQQQQQQQQAAAAAVAAYTPMGLQMQAAAVPSSAAAGQHAMESAEPAGSAVVQQAPLAAAVGQGIPVQTAADIAAALQVTGPPGAIAAATAATGTTGDQHQALQVTPAPGGVALPAQPAERVLQGSEATAGAGALLARDAVGSDVSAVAAAGSDGDTTTAEIVPEQQVRVECACSEDDMVQAAVDIGSSAAADRSRSGSPQGST